MPARRIMTLVLILRFVVFYERYADRTVAFVAAFERNRSRSVRRFGYSARRVGPRQDRLSDQVGGRAPEQREAFCRPGGMESSGNLGERITSNRFRSGLESPLGPKNGPFGVVVFGC